MPQAKDNVEMQKLNPSKAGEAAGEPLVSEPIKIPPGKLTLPLLFAMAAAAFGSSFQFGYHIGVINNPKEVIQETWIRPLLYPNITGENKTSKSEEEIKVHLDFIWALVVSMFPVGAIFGALLSGMVAEKFGRKGGLLLNNLFAFIAAALMGFSKVVGTYWLLILGRFVIGFNAGINSSVCPMYLTEIAPINFRGVFGSVNQFVLVGAILISGVLGLSNVLGTEELWPLLFGLTIVPAIFQVIALPFCPESPKHLLIVKHQNERAEKALIKLRKDTNVKAEMDEMQLEFNKMKSAPKVLFTDLFRAPYLWPLFLSVMLMLAQQLSGINVAMFYSTVIFKMAKLTGEQAQFATLGLGCVNLLMTGISTLIIDKAGRRSLMLISLVGMFFTTIGLVVMLKLLAPGILVENSSGMYAVSYLAIAFLLLFVLAFATGAGSIPWFYVSELFTQAARSNAASIACTVNWLATFLVGLIFLPLNNAIGEFSFLVFTTCLAFFIVFTFFFIPETRNRTVEDIAESFEHQKRVR